MATLRRSARQSVLGSGSSTCGQRPVGDPAATARLSNRSDAAPSSGRRRSARRACARKTQPRRCATACRTRHRGWRFCRGRGVRVGGQGFLGCFVLTILHRSQYSLKRSHTHEPLSRLTRRVGGSGGERDRFTADRRDSTTARRPACFPNSDCLEWTEPEGAAAAAVRPHRLYAPRELPALIGRPSGHALLEVYG